MKRKMWKLENLTYLRPEYIIINLVVKIPPNLIVYLLFKCQEPACTQ